MEGISNQDMTAVDGAFGYYQVSIDDSQTKVKFLRMKGDKSQQWNATAELTIPTDGNDCYTITGWGNNDGNWSKYTAPDPVDPSSIVYSIKHPWKGGSWSYKDLTPNGDGTYSIRDIYGGDGCNWKSTVSGEKWVGTPTLVGSPAKGDSAIFTLTSTEGDGAITITKISSTTGGEGGEGGDPTPDPDPVINDTVFFVNTSSWGTVKCYAWKGSTNNTWPGADMTKADYQLKGADVYYYVAESGAYENCIINNGDGSKTDDLTWTAGKYFYNGAWKTLAELEGGSTGGEGGEGGEVITLPVIKLLGSMNGWNGVELVAAEDKLTASVLVDLEGGTTYKFKFKVDETWYGNGGTIESDITGWTFGTEAGDCTIKTNAKGLYLFTWTYENKSLAVTYPSSTATAVSNAEAENVTVKVIRNGQVLIVREGVTYNMMGQVIQ